MSTKNLSVYSKINIDDVLNRVAKLNGLTKDTEIASELCVARQAVSTWRKRGTIPWDVLCSYAQDCKYSLDYLLLGVAPGITGLEQINLSMIDLIEKEFCTYNIEELVQLKTGSAYDIGLIYNNIISTCDSDDLFSDLIRKEVKFLINIRRRDKQERETDEPISFPCFVHKKIANLFQESERAELQEKDR